MAEHDDAEEASGQCARACGALTRVRRACLWRARRACATTSAFVLYHSGHWSEVLFLRPRCPSRFKVATLNLEGFMKGGSSRAVPNSVEYKWIEDLLHSEVKEWMHAHSMHAHDYCSYLWVL